MICSSLQVVFGGFTEAEKDWNRLHSLSREPFVFNSSLWHRVWWENFGFGEPLIASVRSDGEVKLVASMNISDGIAHYIGGEDLTDYHDFIYAADSPSSYPYIRAAIEALFSLEGVRRINLRSLQEDSPTCDNLIRISDELRLIYRMEYEDVAPRLILPNSWEGYLAMLSKKNRHELRRKLRRLEGSGDIHLTELFDHSEISAGMDEFFALHRMSSYEKKGFMTDAREAFFRLMTASLAHREQVRLLFLELDGERVAVSLSFVVGDIKYLYNSGYNPAYGSLAVGLLNHVYNIKRSIEEGFTVFDFMRGAERYKIDLGAYQKRLINITLELSE